MPGNTAVGLSFDTTTIKQADEAIKKLVKNAETGIGKVNKMWKDMTKDGLNHFIQRLGVAQNAMSKLSNVKVNVRLSGQANDIKRLGDSASRAIIHVNKLLTAMQRLARLNINIVGSGGSGSPSAMDAQKIKYLQDQIKLLQDQLKIQKEIGKAVGAQTTNTDKATRSMSGLGNAARKVRQIAGTIFSVQALMGYGNQLLKIRGEFEMQHRSLQVLLQDVDKANELWDKTVALAVKSPFRVKELVTYTKQLAAYRVEADKLYETNRMLADVSAGLGVDMNRLILAFGQVKAANFLRGTELRQFSEAGVNMLDELAKRFTALEGRVVTVGDVFERVSKRMVSFADVEAVFQTITSEGGVFYKMQEKQSETLRGMMMNLRDSIDLMFNDIGMSSDNVIKRAVGLVKELVDNWREMIPLLKAVGIGFGAAFATKGIAAYIKALVTLNKQVKQVGLSMAMLKSVNVWSFLIAAIAGVITYLVAAKKNTNELVAAMNQIDTDVTKQLEESITLYRKLAARVRDVTATEEERSEAMGQLKSKFDEILPDQLLELEYIKGISDNYDEATNAMMNYYNAKATEQKKDRVESLYAEELEGTDVPDLIRSLRNRIDKITVSDNFTENERLKQILLAGVGGAVGDVVEAIKNGEIDADTQSLISELEKRLAKYAGIEEFTLFENVKGYYSIGEALLSENIDDIIETLTERNAALEGVMGLPFKTYAEQEAADIFLPQKENIENVKSTFKEVINLVNEYAGLAVSEWTELDKRFKKIVGKLPEEASAYLPLLYDMLEKMKVTAASMAEGGASFDFGKSVQGFQQEFTHGLADVMWSQTGAYMFDPLNEGIHKELVQLVTNMDNTLRDEAAKLNLTPFQESVVSAMEIIAKETGVSVNEFVKFLPKMGDSVSTTRKAVEGEIALLESDIERWNNSLKAMPPESIAKPDLDAEREDTLGLTQEQVDNFAKLVEAYKILWKYLGGGEKEKKGRTDNTLDERIKVIDQMNKKYKELKKTLSEGESLEGAFKAYKDAFATAYGREDVRDMSVDDFVKNVLNFASEDEIVIWLKNLAASVSKKVDKVKVELAIGKFEMDEKERAKKELDEALEKEIQDMFDQYDLSLDLKKLNISPEIAKSLFGIESIGLEDVRKKVEDELAKARAVGGNKDRIEQLEKDLEKINDMEEDAQIKRLKTYLEYTRDAIGERAKIKVEEMTKLQEIDETFTKAMSNAKTEEDKKRIAEQKKLAEEGVKKEANEKMQKKDWGDFKTSETFVSIFRDLDTASDDLLKHAIERIQEFREEWKDMPIADAKEMINKLNELEMALLDTGKPFADYREVNKEIENAMLARQIKPNARSGKSQQELREDIGKENAEMEDIIAKASLVESVLQTINNATGENKQAQLELVGINADYVKGLGLSVDVLTNTSEKNQEIIDKKREEANLAGKNISQNNRILMQLNKQKTRLEQQASALGNAQKMAHDLYDAFKGLATALGADEDSPASIFADMGMSMLDTVLNTIMLQIQLNAATIAAQGLGVAMNAAMGVIGWIVMAIQLLAQLITAIVQANDKRIDAQVEALKEKVEELEKRYDKLAESVDEIYSIGKLRRVSAELENIYKQEKKNLQAAIALRESDKNISDEEWDEIQSLKEDLADLEEQHKKTKKEMMEDLGAVSNVRDATQEFVDAWVDAFKETGDGLSGLQEHFTEFWDDIVAKQATMKVAERFLKPLFDQLEQDLSDYEITQEEAKALKEMAEATMPGLSETLEKIWTALGGSMGETSGGLSALQKGIQGITEETAQVIEAYLNSVRMYVATISADTTSQLNEVKAIHRLLDSVTLGGHSRGGVGFKVFMD